MISGELSLVALGSDENTVGEIKLQKSKITPVQSTMVCLYHNFVVLMMTMLSLLLKT